MTSVESVVDRLPCRLFLVLHDMFSGKPVVGSDELRIAVVGAQLAELVLSGRIELPDGGVRLAHARRQDDAEPAGFVVDAIATRDQVHDVPTWILTLGGPVVELVADQLRAQGVVRRAGRGLFGLGPERFPAANLLASARPRIRLEHMIRYPRGMDRAGAVCAALVGAVDAHRVLAVDGDRAQVREAVDAATASLPEDLRTLLAGVEAAQSMPPFLRMRPTA